MIYNKQVQGPHPRSVETQKLKLLQHSLKSPMYSNSQMSSTTETSTKSKIVWNKLKSNIDVLQPAGSWNPNFVKVAEWILKNPKYQ